LTARDGGRLWASSFIFIESSNYADLYTIKNGMLSNPERFKILIPNAVSKQMIVVNRHKPPNFEEKII